MLYFVLEVIAVSILVSAFATWIKLVPRYAKWRYYLIQQAINTGILTILLSPFCSFKIYPSWMLLFVLILLVLWLSVRITKNVVTNEIKPTVPSEDQDPKDRHTESL